MLGAISEAFYARGRDTTDVDVLADVGAEVGLERAAFRAHLDEADVRNETFRDFLFAQQSQVHGFPCLLIGNESDGYGLITNGFRAIDGMVPAIENWLSAAQNKRSKGA